MFFKFLFISGKGRGIGQEEHHVGLAQAFQGDPYHLPVEQFPGLVQARGIEHDDLVVRPGDDTQDPVAGGLGPGSDDGDLLAQVAVEQGRFAGIGRADNGHHA